MQIFISYARDDDAVPPCCKYEGFVTHLHGQLLFEFKRLGGIRPRLWRDTKRIRPDDQFGSVIEKAISESDLLLVVLSRNWLNRPWCRRELECFAKRWSQEGEAGIRRRIVIVGKHYVRYEDCPPLLQGQEGYRFFDCDPEDGIGSEHEFFEPRERKDDRYYERAKELARSLWLKGQTDTLPPEPPATVDAPGRRPSSSARVIYLAKPAGDMLQAYGRLVKELQARQYTVVPAPELEIPSDDSAVAFVDEALAKAELSVHLLGEKAGYAPEDQEPIVKLQLARAGARVPDSSSSTAGPTDTFYRILWAPKLLDNGAAPAPSMAERDPLAVLARFDRLLGTDKIEGDSLSKFVDFLTQHLSGIRVPPEPLSRPEGAAAKIYVYHDPLDTDYALMIAQALQERNVEPVLPAFDGAPAEVQAFHRQNLLDCDAVALCWANSTEVWMRSRSRELGDWRKLGRASCFTYRSLVAGPPPGSRKSIYLKMLPRSEIDFIVDVTASEQPPPEKIDALVPKAPPRDGVDVIGAAVSGQIPLRTDASVRALRPAEP